MPRTSRPAGRAGAAPGAGAGRAGAAARAGAAPGAGAGRAGAAALALAAACRSGDPPPPRAPTPTEVVLGSMIRRGGPRVAAPPEAAEQQVWDDPAESAEEETFRQAFLAAVEGRRGPIEDCYTAALAEFPEAKGEVLVGLRVGPDGKVAETAVAPNPLPESMVRCVLDVCRTLVLPAPPGGEATIEYPFTFEQ